MAASSGSRKTSEGFSIRQVVLLSLIYVAIAFGFSFLGFAARQPAIHFHEYSFPQGVEEVGGHFLFGAAAAAPFLSARKSLLGGAFAICIDADHILGALNLNVSSRPDHSFSFAIFATFVMWVLVARLDAGKSINRSYGVAALVPVSILAHVSYDVFATYYVFNGLGFSFPVFAPLSFSLIAFPSWTWMPLEASAVIVAAILTRWPVAIGQSTAPGPRRIAAGSPPTPVHSDSNRNH